MTSEKFKLKTVLSVFLIAVFLLPFFGFRTTAEESENTVNYTEVCDKIAYYCVESGIELYAENADETFSPYAASRLVIALVAVDKVEDFDLAFELDGTMISSFSSRYGLKVGDIVTCRDLVILMLMRGFDDAAYALAVKIAGSADGFVALMNQKAEELSCENTNFESVAGSNGAGYTTARDVAKIAAKASVTSYITAITASESCELSGGRAIHNRNFYKSGYYNGIGTSFLNSAVTGLACDNDAEPVMLIASAVIGGYTYVGVVGEVSGDSAKASSYMMMNDLFSQYSGKFRYVSVLASGTPVSEVNINLGEKQDAVAVVTAQSYSMYIPYDKPSDCWFDLTFETDVAPIAPWADPNYRVGVFTFWDKDGRVGREPSGFSYVYTLDTDNLEAPVKAGERVGSLALTYNGEVVFECDLVLASSENKSLVEYYRGKFEKLIEDNTVQKIILVVVGVLTVLVFANAIRIGQKNKREQAARVGKDKK